MSSTRVRLGLSLTAKLGLSKGSTSRAFDVANKRFEHLRSFVNLLCQRLSSYVLTMTSAQEASLAMSSAILSLLSVTDDGFRAAVALRESHHQGTFGYANHLREAFVAAVVDPAEAWRAEMQELETYVKNFEEARIRYDHYARKVQELSAKVRADKKGDNGKEREKLDRNAAKLAEVQRSYHEVTREACARLNKAWESRLATLNAILARVVLFEEALASHQHMQAAGVSRIMDASLGMRIPENPSIETFLPKAETTHMVGPLVRRGKVIRSRMLFRLVGSTLEVHDLPAGGAGVSAAATAASAVASNAAAFGSGTGGGAALLQEPKEVYEVSGASQAFENGLKVQFEDGPEMVLVAASAQEAEAWLQALGKAALWDRIASSRRVERLLKQALEFKEATRHSDNRTTSQLESELGVTDSFHTPPPPLPEWATLTPPTDDELLPISIPALGSTGAPLLAVTEGGEEGSGRGAQQARTEETRPPTSSAFAQARLLNAATLALNLQSSPGALESPRSNFSKTAPAAVFSSGGRSSIGSAGDASSSQQQQRAKDKDKEKGLRRVWSGSSRWMFGRRKYSGGSENGSGAQTPTTPRATAAAAALPVAQADAQPPDRRWGSPGGAPRAEALPRRNTNAVRSPSTGGSGGSPPDRVQRSETAASAVSGASAGADNFSEYENATVGLQRASIGESSAAHALGNGSRSRAGSHASAAALEVGNSGNGGGLQAPKSDVQAVFERLCATQLPHTSTLASAAPVNCLSWDALAKWDEVQELQMAGALSAADSRDVWEEALAVAPPSPEVPGMNLLGFAAFVRLLEERHFQKELEQVFGVALADGPAVEV